jgi:hypothetical protein
LAPPKNCALSSNIAPPAQGARFDIGFEGKLSGDTLRGVISGIDYLAVRADGQYRLNCDATIITHDGETIAFHEEGIVLPNRTWAKQMKMKHCQSEVTYSRSTPESKGLNVTRLQGMTSNNRAFQILDLISTDKIYRKLFMEKQLHLSRLFK